jgi:hypothetical protein
MLDLIGAVSIDDLVVELPETEARSLFAAAIASAKAGGLIPISPDTVIAVNPSTRFTLTIAGRFADEHTMMLEDRGASAWRSPRHAVVI